MARPKSPLLSTERIGDAAMELVDAGKPFGVNAVARRLGVTPSSLYHHVSGLDEIIELMRGRLVERYSLPIDFDDWEQALTDVLRLQRRMYGEHPFLVPFIVDKVITDERTLFWYDEVVALLERAGFADDELAVALSVTDAFSIGFGLDLAGPERPWGEAEGAPVLRRALDAAPVGRGRSDEAFEWGLRLLIDGLRARLAGRG